MREFLKSALPWLVPVVRRAKAAIEPARRTAETLAVAATFGRGFRASLGPNMSFRVHPLAWRASLRYFAPGAAYYAEIQSFTKTCRPGMRFVDVGANFGAYSLVASKFAGSQSLLLDPSPGSVRMLKQLQTMNPELKRSWVVEQVAAGNTQGEVEMDVLNDFSVGAAITNGRARTVRVHQVMLDHFLAERQFVPTHLKIDVEGWDLHVLEGASRTLRSARPILFLEIHYDYLRRISVEPRRVAEFLAAHHYRCTWVDHEDLPDRLGPFVARTVWTPTAITS